MQTLQETIDMYDNAAEAKAALDGATLVYSTYDTGCYDGGWLVAYIDRDGDLMVDQGSHCSCYGPSFGPSRTTPKVLLASEPYLGNLAEFRAAVLARFPDAETP